VHQVLTVYNDMFYHMDCMMRPLPEKKTQLKEDLFCAVKLARQNLSEYYAAATRLTGLHLVLVHVLALFWKLQSFSEWNMGMEINPQNETSYSTQSQETILKYVENECCAKHQCVLVNKRETLPRSNLVPHAMASGFCQSFLNPDDLSSNDEEHLTPNHVAEMTPR